MGRAIGRQLILIADDYDGAAELLAEALELDFSCETVCAKDGQEAVELTAALHPWAVVLDIDMPRLNGIEAARTIRAVDPLSPALVFAMTGGPLLEVARESGLFDLVLAKPFISDKLCDAMREKAVEASASDIALSTTRPVPWATTLG